MGGAEDVSTRKRRHIEVGLNTVRHVATTWTDADYPKAMERLELTIHPVAAVKCKPLYSLFQHHEQQLLQDVWMKATSCRGMFAN